MIEDGWDVAIGYGLTETAPLLAVNLPGSRRPASVGKPLPGVALQIEPPEETDDAASRQAARRSSDSAGRLRSATAEIGSTVSSRSHRACSTTTIRRS